MTSGVCRRCKVDPMGSIPVLEPIDLLTGGPVQVVPRPCPLCRRGVVRSRHLSTCVMCDKMPGWRRLEP